jgi:hypothetical protein
VNEKFFPVKPNLKFALQRLRPALSQDAGQTGELVLWVDAICINQEDIPERSVQTSKMRSIYQNASGVAVWLGLENHGSGRAMKFSRDLNLVAMRDGSDGVRRMVDESQMEELHALVVLFRRQYWWRIWVIQEVSVANSAMVYCGDEAISWHDLDNVCDILKAEQDALHAVFYKSPSYVRTLTFGGPRGLQLSRYSPSADAPPLLELLLSHKSKKSTDPKDKVYALVGISSTRQTFGPIDYSRSMREIYTHTARHIIHTSQKLDVICVRQHNENQFDLPSWAPDWTRPPVNSGHTVVGLQHREPAFAAAGSSIADARFLGGGYVLQTTGVVLDTVKLLGMPFKRRGPPSDVVPSLHAFHDWWNLFVASKGNSVSAQRIFGRVISAGNWIYDDENAYAAKLEAVFKLSDQLLTGEDLLRFDPPSRSSTGFSEEDVEMLERSGQLDEENDEKAQMGAILSAALTMSKRRLIMSETGIVGLAPWDSEEGDVVCVLLGCRFPVVLRRVERHYILVGEAYFEGYMDGETMVELKEGRYQLGTFEIH